MLQLTACGFHLKGTGEKGVYAFKSIQVIENNATHRELVVNLKRQLTASNVDLVVSSQYIPELVLELDQTRLKSSTTSTSGLGAETSELLTMSQAYVVTDSRSNKVVAQATAKVWRDRLINNAARLASESELRQIRAQMRADLAQQILQRLQHIKLPNTSLRAK